MFKTIATASALVLTASFASAADGHFGILTGFDENDAVLSVPLVRASDAGMVQIESLQGDVLGTASVNAGANANVLINLGSGPTDDVVAKLIINGEVADQERVEVR